MPRIAAAARGPSARSSTTWRNPATACVAAIGCGASGNRQIFVIDRVDAEEAIVAVLEAEHAGDGVQVRAGAEDVGVLADEHQPAAALDESQHGVDLLRRVIAGGRLDDEHVAVFERGVVERLGDAGVIVEPRAVIEDAVVIVRRHVPVPLGVERLVGASQTLVPSGRYSSTRMRLPARVPIGSQKTLNVATPAATATSSAAKAAFQGQTGTLVRPEREAVGLPESPHPRPRPLRGARHRERGEQSPAARIARATGPAAAAGASGSRCSKKSSSP